MEFLTWKVYHFLDEEMQHVLTHLMQVLEDWRDGGGESLRRTQMIFTDFDQDLHP